MPNSAAPTLPVPGLSPAHAVLARVFGHETFREGQQQAVEALVAGRDALVVLPTGGGKSLCYQVPAVLARQGGRGPTLVVSPLIALMDDQVRALRAKGIAAAALHSSQDELIEHQLVGELLTGKLDIVYVSPERAVSASFRRLLRDLRVALLAVDEAHCISHWGHDFRPEYMRLGELRRLLSVPTVALTATATPRVAGEIVTSLGLETPVRVRTSFARPNLRFAVRQLARQAERLSALVERLVAMGFREPGSGRALVYCATRKKVEAVVETLQAQRFAAGGYHAGMSDRAREKAHKAYDAGRTRVLVATNAFGMGVDYPNVRLIVHFQAPASIEAYYQEAGRAGRDGRDSVCELYFGAADLVTQRFLSRKSPASASRMAWREHALEKISTYASATECRQEILCRHFEGDDTEVACGQCDVCRGEVLPAAREDVAHEAQAPERSEPGADEHMLATIMQAAASLRRPVGKTTLAKALRGSRAKALRRLGLIDIPEHGALSTHSEHAIVEAIELLLRDKQLERRGCKYPTVWLAGRPVRQAARHSRAGGNPAREGQRSHLDPRVRGDDEKGTLGRALESYRRRTARTLRWKRYMVFTNEVISQIEAQRPGSLWELTQIRGLGPAKIERFGQDLLALIRKFDD